MEEIQKKFYYFIKLAFIMIGTLDPIRKINCKISRIIRKYKNSSGFAAIHKKSIIIDKNYTYKYVKNI